MSQLNSVHGQVQSVEKILHVCTIFFFDYATQVDDFNLFSLNKCMIQNKMQALDYLTSLIKVDPHLGDTLKMSLHTVSGHV